MKQLHSCLCHRKGNEFWANHNCLIYVAKLRLVVFVTAKVMNFEQITTSKPTINIDNGCLCHRKGNEFWANHNRKACTKYHNRVVFVTAKVMNFEQITTLSNYNRIFVSCLCHRKGNEFWANHNFSEDETEFITVVFVTAKVMNFEQITTKYDKKRKLYVLSLSPQR